MEHAAGLRRRCGNVRVVDRAMNMFSSTRLFINWMRSCAYET